MGSLTPLAALLDRHTPTTEEMEIWSDDEDHDRLFPLCKAVVRRNVQLCEGHTVERDVCSECGYEHDGDQPIYRAWPCPTVVALRTVLDDSTQPRPSSPLQDHITEVITATVVLILAAAVLAPAAAGVVWLYRWVL